MGGGTGGEQGGGTGGGNTGGGTGGGLANRAPSIEPLADVSLSEGMTTQVTVVATDPDGDTLQLTLTAPPSWATISGNVITLAPTFADSGSYSLGVQASDARGGISAGTLNVTVENAGQAPTWTAISPVTMPENTTRVVPLLATDPDGTTVTYTLAMNPPAWASLTGNQLTLTPGFEVIAGGGVGMSTFNVFVEARNAGGGMALTSVVVVVSNSNRPPVFADFAATLDEGTPLSIPLVASDLDVGDTVTFSFVGTPPPFISLAGTQLVTDAGFLAADGSPYSVVLRATDGDLNTNATLTLTVNDVNGPPVFAALAPVTMDEGQSQQLTLVATDPDGDPVTFRSLTTLPPWASLANGVLTLAPDYSAAAGSPFTFNLEAADSLAAGHQVTRIVEVTITNVNRDPSIENIADITVAELATAQVLLTALDPDGEALTFTVTDDKGGIGTATPGSVGQFITMGSNIILNPRTGTFLLSPVTVTVTVRDPAMRSATTTFRIFITSTNTAPTISGLQQFNSFNILMAPGADAGPGEITLRGTTSDPQGDDVKLEAEVRLLADTFASPDAGANGSSFFAGALGQVDAGIQPLLQLSSLASGAYKWQVRAVDESGLHGPWVPYNAGNVAFVVPQQDVTGTVSINNGAPNTSTPQVSVNLALSPGAGASSILTVELSDLAEFDGGVANIFPNSASVPWTLPAGGGSRTVFVKATDNLLRTAVFSDTIVLDSSAPTIDSFTINAGAGAINTVNASLSFSTSDVGTGIKLYEASNDGTTFTVITPGTSVPWPLSAGEGVKTVTLRITDHADNVTTATDTVIVDLTPPVVGNVSLNSGAAFTTTRPISVSITATDSGGAGLSQACLSEGVPSNCVTFTATGSLPFTLSSGDSLKVVQVKVRDAAGNESNTAAPYPADSIVLDTSPPTVSGVSLNAGATWTTSTTVTVTLNANDSNGVASIAFSTDGTSFSAPEVYLAAGNTFTLPAGDGPRTVYVRLTDSAGNLSAVGLSASDGIVVDTTPPAISSFSINSGATASNNDDVDLSFVASDTGSGLTAFSYQASNDGTVFTGINSVSPANFRLSAGDGAKTVTLKVIDQAGNASTATSNISLDTVAPTLISVQLAGGRPFTNQSTISVDTVSDGSGASELCITNSGFPEQCVPYAASYASWALTAGQGAKTVIVALKDAAGNRSAPQAPSITVDTTPPTLTSITVNAGASYTGSSTVTVTAVGSDTVSSVADIAFSNDGTTYGAFVPYEAAGNSHLLAAGEGTRTVSAKIRDGAGNESTARSDSIIADVTPPAGTVILAANAVAINAPGTTYVVSANDTNGLQSMCVRESPIAPPAGDPCFVPYATTATAITLSAGDGTKTVYAWFRDNTGLISAAAGTDTVFLDTAAPALSAASLNSGASLTSTVGASMGFTATDTGGSGLSQVCVSLTNGASLGGCSAYLSPAPITLSAGDGSKTVYLQVIDLAGNRSPVLSDTIVLDATAPVGTVILAAGASAIGAPATSYSVSATDANGVQRMCVRETSTAPLATDPCFVPYSTSATPITLATGDGTKTVRAWFLDNAGLVSAAAATDTVILDTAAPTLSGASIAGGASFTSLLSVSVSFTAADANGLSQVCLSTTAGTPQGGCLAYANPANFTLPAGDGLKTVYLQVRDAAGNLSPVVSDTITLDTSAPSGTVNVAGAAVLLNTVSTTFVVNATDTNGVQAMCVQEVATAPLAADPCFVTYSTAATPFTLSAAQGLKTVYAWFRDGAGVVSTAAATDTVTLDTAAPALSLASLNGGAPFTTGLGVTMGFTATDTGGSGVDQVCVSETNAATLGGCAPLVNPAPFTLPSGEGSKTVYLQVIDLAGNRSAVLNDTITLDTTGPSGTLVVGAGAVAVNTAATTFTVSATDANGVQSMCVRESAAAPAAADPCFVPYSTTATAINLSAGEGTKVVFGWFKDNAGLVSASPALGTVVLDTIAPTISTASLNNDDSSTNQLVVSMGFVAGDSGSGLAQVCLSATTGSPQGGCIPYENPAAFTMASGDGEKTVYVQVRDAAGNLSAVVSDTITLNTSGPVGTVTVAGGATAINSGGTTYVVSATAGADTVTGMCVRESPATPASSAAATPPFADPCFVAYTTVPTAITLSAGDGPKTVYAWFVNNLGTISGGAATDTVVLDTGAPALSLASLNAGAAYTSVQGVSLGFTASDTGGSGLFQVCTSSSAGSPQPNCVPYVNPVSFTLPAGDGAKTVYVQVKDVAGNLSTVLNDTITLDTAAPSGSVTLSAGAAAINTLATTFVVSASDSSGIASMCVRELATVPLAADPCFVAYTTAATNITLGAGDGTKTVRAWFKDNAGVVSAAAATDTVVLDTTAPVLAAPLLNGGATFTTALGVSMGFSISEAGSGPSQVCVSSTAGDPQGGCVAYANPANFTLAAGEGVKTVYLQVRDGAGNRSAVISDTIILDTAPPTGTLVVSSGAAAISAASTTYVVTATDTNAVTHMCVRESPTQPGSGDGCFVPFSTAATGVVLSMGDGTKTLYAWFKDSAGLVSAAAATDTVILDTIAPVLTTAALNGGAALTTSTSATMDVTASDTGGSGLTEICLSLAAGSPQAGCITYADPANFTLPTGDALKTVYVQVKDAAGNLSAVLNDTITLDTAPPTGTVSLAGGDVAINTTATLYRVTATDLNGLQSMCVREAAGQPAANDPCFVTFDTSSTNITLSAGDGTKTVNAWFKDNAGLVSAVTATDSILLDTVVPTLSAPSLNGGATLTSVLAATMAFTATDTGGSGTSQVCMSSTAGNPQGGCVAITNPANFTLPAGDGLKTVYLQVVDVAGNRSAVLNDTITLDTAAPTGSIVLSGGVVAINNVNTTYVATASDTNGVAAMCVRTAVGQPAANDPCFVSYSTAATSINLGVGDGTKTAYGWFRDTVGLVSAAAAVDTVLLDTVAPSLSLPTLNAGASYTRVLGVNMSFTASDSVGGSGLSQVCMSTTVGNPQTGCLSYANPAAFTLAGPDGSKTVYLQVRDVAGNLSTVLSDSIILDTTLPTGSVTLSGGAVAVNNPGTSYTASAADLNGVAKMCVKESAAAPASNDPCFVTYSTVATTIGLSAGDATKTVYAWFLDVADNVSAAAATDSVILDTVAPSLSLASINGNAGYTNNPLVSMNVTASDTGGSGLGQICRSITSGSPQGNCISYVDPVSFTFTGADGSKTLYVQVIDQAGNRSTVLSDSIILDTTVPTLTSISVAAGATYTNSTTVQVTAVASDTYGIADIAFANDGVTFAAPVSYVLAGNTHTLTTGDGVKTVTARVRDPATNVSLTASDTIILDATRPSGTVVINNADTYTNAPTTAILTLTSADPGGSGVVSMCLKTVSTAPTLPSDACWEPFAATRFSFDLGVTNGTRTAYAWFLDAAGNISTAATDTIFLDTVLPTTLAGAPTCSWGHRTIDCTSGTASDTGGSGIAGYEFGYGVTSGSGYAVTTPVVTTPAWVITGLQNNVIWYTVARAVDNAGNRGAWSPQNNAAPRFPFSYEHREPTSATLNAVIATDPTNWIGVGDFGVARRSSNTMSSSSPLDVLSDEGLYGLNKDPDGHVYVVGAGGHYAWSDNAGVNWRKGVVNDSGRLNSITWAGDTISCPFLCVTSHWFVAVGANGKILRGARTEYFSTLSDLELSAVTSPTSNGLLSVTRTLAGNLVAVGNNGIIIRSTNDGVSWSIVTPPAAYASSQFRTVAAGATAGSDQVFIGTKPTATSGAGASSLLLMTGTTISESTGFTGISVHGLHIARDGDTTNRYFLTGNALSGISELTTPRILTYDGTYDVQTLPSGVTQGGRSIYAFWDSASVDWNVVSVGLEGQVTYELSWEEGVASSWVDANQGADVSLYDVELSPNNSLYGYTVGSSGFLGKSTNAGGTWTQVTADAGTQVFRGVAVTGTSAPYTAYAVSSAGGIYGTNTGLTTATRLNTPTSNYLYAVSCFTPTDCFTTGAGGTIIQLSGSTWTNLGLSHSGNAYTGVATYLTGGVRHAIIVGQNGVTRALTNTTWASEVPYASAGYFYGVAANLTGNGTALAIANTNHVWRTTNHGSSWTDVGTVPAVSSQISITWGGGTTWYTAGYEGQMFKSTNDGANWTLLQSNSGSGQFLFGVGWTPSNYVYGVGSNGTVLRSPYGGE